MNFIDEVVSAICEKFPGATHTRSDAVVQGRRLVNLRAGGYGHVLYIEPRDSKCRIVHAALSISARREPPTITQAVEAAEGLVYKAVQEHNNKQAERLTQQQEIEDRLAPLIPHLDISNDIVTFGRVPKDRRHCKEELINAGLLTPRLLFTARGKAWHARHQE